MLLLSLAFALCPQEGAAVAQPEFAYAHISDIHVEVFAEGSDVNRPERGQETFEWMKEVLRQDQPFPRADGLPGASPPPEFVLATGDLTEFGAPGQTWSRVERLFDMLPAPVYAVPGNHDDTWTPTAPFLEARHGGRNYAFEKHGVLFCGLASSTIQEPVPCLSRDDLSWLKETLDERAQGKPVVLFMHHPPDSAEFAQPQQRQELMQVLEGHEILLLHYGHGHRPKHHVTEGIDCLQGGTTFSGKGRDDRGYLYVHVAGGKLRATYRFFEVERPAVLLYEGEFRSSRSEPSIEGSPKAPKAYRFRSTMRVGGVPVIFNQIPEYLVMLPQSGQVCAVYEGDPGQPTWMRQVPGEVVAPGAAMPGWAAVCTTRGFVVVLGMTGGLVRFEKNLGQPIYAAPLYDERTERLFVGDVAGKLHALDAESGDVLWSKPIAEGPFDAAPVRFGELVVAGAWDGMLHAVDPSDGQVAWRSAGPRSSERRAARYYSPADCPPVALGDRLFVCDRGYELGWYDAKGEMTKLPYQHVSAIGASKDGASLYLRGTNHSLRKIDRDGVLLWEAKVAAGRFPKPPIEVEGRVAVVSDRGELTWFAAEDGRFLKQADAQNGGAYVMANAVWNPTEEGGQLHVFSMNGCWTRHSLPALVGPSRAK